MTAPPDVPRSAAGSGLSLPASWYTGDEQWAQEKARLFDHRWWLAGHESQLASPGDFVSGQFGRYPLVALRDSGGQLRAHYNVCRHRAGPLVSGAGHCDVLRCRYHGWTYGLDGRLDHAPEFGEHPSLTGSLRLKPAGLSRWAGLLWLHPDRTAPADPVLAEIGTTLNLDFADFRPGKRHSYTLECNWKCYVDNYLEGYHLQAVHPGLSQMLDAENYATRVFDRWSLQSSPIRDSDQQAFYVWRFPDLMLNVLPDRLQTNRVVPVASNRCVVVFDYFYRPQVAARAQASDQQSAHQTQLEDIEICEAVQNNMTSGAWRQGPLSPRWEGGLQHFHQLLRAELAQPQK